MKKLDREAESSAERNNGGSYVFVIQYKRMKVPG